MAQLLKDSPVWTGERAFDHCVMTEAFGSLGGAPEAGLVTVRCADVQQGDSDHPRALNKQLKAQWESQRASVAAYKKVAHTSLGKPARPLCGKARGGLPPPLRSLPSPPGLPGPK